MLRSLFPIGVEHSRQIFTLCILAVPGSKGQGPYGSREEEYATVARNWTGCLGDLNYIQPHHRGRQEGQSVQQKTVAVPLLPLTIIRLCSSFWCSSTSIKWIVARSRNDFRKMEMVKNCSMHNGQNGILPVFDARSRYSPRIAIWGPMHGQRHSRPS